MPEAQKPENEKERIQALRSYEILDSLSEQEYDNIVHLASFICDTPIALVSIVDDDRQWFKAKKGLGVDETPRELAFCAHAILDPNEALIVEDATLDDRFSDNALVTGAPDIRFYAGCPLNTSDGFPLGTLCAIDTKPKKLSSEQVKSLTILSENVVSLLELRKANFQKKKLIEDLNKSNDELEEFSYRVSHDLRSPIVSSMALLNMTEETIRSGEVDTALQCIQHGRTSLESLERLIVGILQLSRAKNEEEEEEAINFETLFNETLDKLKHMDHFERMDIRQDLRFSDTLVAKKGRIVLIVENLISNAVKYQDLGRDDPFVEISTYGHDKNFVLEVRDNGLGIPENQQDKIFQMFKRFHPQDAFGSGLGLYMTKKSADILGGDICFESLDEGSVFKLIIPLKN